MRKMSVIKMFLFVVVLCCSFFALSGICYADNPIITDIYTADPTARVDKDGRLYVYPSHDIEPNRGCDLMDQYHVYSTTDMVNWTDHGEILRASQVPWGRPEGGFMWAPDCIYKDGTYYYYFPHPSGTEWNTTWKIGIATSTSPASGFVCQSYIPGLDPLIDPNVFIDDDGQAYFYHGGGNVCKGGKLKDNMMEIDGSMQTMQGLNDYHEGTWVYKRNGIYYLLYADNHSDSTGDNRMLYATGNNPLGPWTYRGVVLDPTDSYCSHGSIVEYKGQWYLFYFNSSISNNDWLRSTCVDRLYFNADGTIQKVIQTTTSVPAVTGNYPDFVITDISWTPANPSLGDAVTLQATVKNQGQAAGVPGVVSFKADQNQVAVSNNNTSLLAPGQSITINANTTWQASGGTHKIVALADVNNTTVEVDNYNNFENVSMTVETGPAPDFIVTDISWNPAIPSNGNAVTFHATIQNQGTLAGAPGVVAFSLGGTQIAASSNQTNAMNAGATTVITASSTWTAVTGNYNLAAVVDKNSLTAEADETNNARNESFTVLSGPKADLIVTDISWSPENPSSGNAVTFKATIKNIGSGATPSGIIHGVAFQIDGGGTSLWSDTYTTSIPAGSSVTLTVNGGTAGSTWSATTGTHQILAWVDDVNRMPEEIDENNNQYTENITIGSVSQPDLIVTDITYTPANPVAGNAVTFQAVVKNQGTTAGAAGIVTFKVNGNQVTTSANNTTAIAAGASQTITATGTWTAAAGNYSITATADNNNTTVESNESNNSYSENLTIAGGGVPDLIVTDISWNPANPAAGTAVTFSATIKNQGTAATPSGVIHGVAFQIDGGGTSLWSDTYTTSIPAGSSVTLIVNGGTAGSTWNATTGTHQILAWVDDVNRIPNEANENNNQYTESLTVGVNNQPDFVITDITYTPANPVAGNTVTFSAVVRNQGMAAGAAGVISFKTNGNQVAASANNTSQIAVGTNQTITANGPWNAIAGSYTLSATADNYNTTVESNESNNTYSENLNITGSGAPDLIVTDISWSPANPTSGNAVTFSATIKNQGTAATPSGVIHGVAFQIDGGGTSLWSDNYTTSIPAGGTATVTVNGGTAGAVWSAISGTHQILAWVDDVNRMSNEVNENNNQYTESLTVSAVNRPDLVVTDIAYSPETPSAGNAVTFRATIKNQGTAAGATGIVAFQVNGNQVTVSANNTTSLAAGATVLISATSTWTAVNGVHSVTATADNSNTTVESNESNNSSTEELVIGNIPAGDIIGKVYAGYQGWFNCYGDGSPVERWRHWSNGTYQSNTGSPAAGAITFELYPDVSEYTDLYQTNLGNLGNGQPAELFSSYSTQTVNKHFEWMQTYGIDGVALQRFAGELSDPVFRDNRNSIATKVKSAAENYGRKFYIMYDISGMSSNFDTILQNDWTNTVSGSLNLTSSSAYAKQDGKPVVCIWGIGFTHCPGDVTQSLNLINWFKAQGCYVIGGVPTHWRLCINDSKPGFENVYKAFHMISPWTVGRFKNLTEVDNFKNNQLVPDLSYCNANGIAYQPVMVPGFAWSNWHSDAPRNECPRLHGDFMWRQAYNIKSLGISTGYVAMFDEYDEGTAIAKAAENSQEIPTNQYFLTLDADGVACSSDFYLRLTGDITRMFKGQIPLTTTHPTSHQ
ncbi:MAG: Xylosidase/arabinosidase [Herbinix sp.]|nr:Xylosidase/arabinosidase [Herbinix sp.]